jgi:hypothetical protein
MVTSCSIHSHNDFTIYNIQTIPPSTAINAITTESIPIPNIAANIHNTFFVHFL